MVRGGGGNDWRLELDGCGTYIERYRQGSFQWVSLLWVLRSVGLSFRFGAR